MKQGERHEVLSGTSRYPENRPTPGASVIGLAVTIVIMLHRRLGMLLRVLIMALTFRGMTAVLLKKTLGPLLGDVAILVRHVLPRVAFTRGQDQGKGGNQQAQKFHRAPI